MPANIANVFAILCAEPERESDTTLQNVGPVGEEWTRRLSIIVILGQSRVRLILHTGREMEWCARANQADQAFRIAVEAFVFCREQ